MKYQPLKDIAQIVMGQSPDSNSYNDLGDGLPFFQGNADFGELYPSERIWCNEPKKIANPNDILISVRAPIGALNYANKRCCIGRGLAAITVTNPAERNYVFYLLKAKNAELNHQGTGSTFKAIGKNVLEEIAVPIVPPETQLYIMNLMNITEKIIAKRKQELKYFDDIIKARFVEMFGDPVANPKNWRKLQLQQLVTQDCSISYGIVQTGDDVENGIPVFRPVDIVGRIPTRNELKRTTNEISNRYKRTALKGRELLITVRANIADTFIAGADFNGCNVGRGIVPIRTDESKMRLEFLKALIDCESLNRYIKTLAKGITLIQLNMEDLRGIELILPPINLQDDYIKLYKQIDKSKVAV